MQSAYELPTSLDAESAARYRHAEMERERLLRDAIMRKVGQARHDPKHFFSFVMREETSRDRVVCLPHQRVLFDFVMHYPRSVVRMPVGFSKTYSMGALTMWLLGQDVTARGAIISATQEQAKKPVGLVRDYIESSAELRLVYPKLRPSPRDGDPWTQTKLVVDRPPGIRDPSLTAVGVEGALPGARLSWLLIDDILDSENTNTEGGLLKVRKWFNTTVLSRRDVRGAKVVVTNTPWNPEDLTYALEAAGWPTLTMDCEGGIYFSNADDFDTLDVRPSIYDPDGRDMHRLTANDAPEILQSHYHEMGRVPETDEDEIVPLWPQKFTRDFIAELRDEYAAAMHEFNQLYMCVCRSDEDGKVKVSWIEECKKNARDLDIFSMESEYDGPNPVFTGVDLAVGKKKKNDYTALFTFEARPKGMRRILHADYGRWSGRIIVDKIIEIHEQFNSIIAVENNAAQDYLRQWVLDQDKALPIRPHTTGNNKADHSFGVESIFIEVQNGAWLIPNDPRGKVHDAVQMWLKGMLYYDPDGHTNDMLMASWIAREQARKSGALRRERKGATKGRTGSLAANIMAR